MIDNLIKCESCKKHIHPDRIEIIDIALKQGKQKRIWKCIHCGHEHLIMITNKTTRRMMQANKKDRERISGINRNSQLLRKQNKFTGEQAQEALSRMETLEERIEKRTKEIDERSRELMDEYILSLRVD